VADGSDGTLVTPARCDVLRNPVHFEVNKLGLVNVYAKDIALLPEWQRQIWCGHNAGPEGGVSEELLAAQMQSRPADTQAPEAFLSAGLELLAKAARERYGIHLLKMHNQTTEILERCHRFRAVDSHGLFALAKDLARLTADSIDAGAIHVVLGCEKNDRPGSLKSLERLLATIAVSEMARDAVAPLVGIYEMRLADAHLPSSQVLESYALVGVDKDAVPIIQGLQLLSSCVTCLHWIAELLDYGNRKTHECAR
jgi:hypothetical protein